MKYPKTKELIYSLMRSVIAVRNEELKNKINYWSMQLFEDLILENFEKSLKTTKLLSELLKFGKMIYEVESINSDILIRELESLESAIRQYYGFAALMFSCMPSTGLSEYTIASEALISLSFEGLRIFIFTECLPLGNWYFQARS